MQIQIASISKRTVLVPANSFEIITDSFSKQKGDKILLQDTTPHLIDCKDWEHPEESLIVFTYNSNKVVFTLIGPI